MKAKFGFLYDNPTLPCIAVATRDEDGNDVVDENGQQLYDLHLLHTVETREAVPGDHFTGAVDYDTTAERDRSDTLRPADQPVAQRVGTPAGAPTMGAVAGGVEPAAPTAGPGQPPTPPPAPMFGPPAAGAPSGPVTGPNAPSDLPVTQEGVNPPPGWELVDGQWRQTDVREGGNAGAQA